MGQDNEYEIKMAQKPTSRTATT
ncbi:Protein CBG25910 [Caenorhabditis briggsae]|uniref:Protein CBG25910 n=1 Tax=Caenorhabditis briggsae TaxID=6238 RepID=B6IHM0_CAEBR|nr:Protein CBG25910 [Caenorhabditis briggsae]CAR99421.1 Protein CBG25910 [Caenorhabditis briggsae]